MDVPEAVRVSGAGPSSAPSKLTSLRTSASRKRAVIDMRTAEDGTFVLVNHAFNFPGRGAIAVFSSS